MEGDPDDRAQRAKVWEVFDGQSKVLEKDLQKFQEVVQELGSSLNLALSTQNLRDCVRMISWMVRENASQLFPQTIKKVEPPAVDSRYLAEQMYSFDAPLPKLRLRHSLIGPIYVQLEMLANAISSLKDVLVEFPDLGISGHRTLEYSQNDLKYWSSCLVTYKNVDSLEVKSYVHDLCQELGDYFQEISLSIESFITRVPAVRLSQQHAMSNLQNFATIATFFSAVTATTLQYSFQKNDDGLSQAVNVFWFSSLVFSIASALNSSLVLMWRSARYSPRPQIPSWLWVWVRQCPPAFLLLSVVSFLVGLGCFTISSQKPGTWIAVLICEGLSSLSLMTLLVWLVWDKWTFSHLKYQNGHPSHIFLESKMEHKVWPTEPADNHNYIPEYTSQVDPGSKYPPHSAHTRFSPRSSVAHPSHDSHSLFMLPNSQAVTTLSPAQQRWDRVIRRIFLQQRTLQASKDSQHMVTLQNQLANISKTLEEFHYVNEAVVQNSATIHGPIYNSKGTSLAVCGDYSILRFEPGSNKSEQLPLNAEAHQMVWSYGSWLLTRTDHFIHVWPPTGDPHIINRLDKSSFILGISKLQILSHQQPLFVSIEGSHMNKLSVIDINGLEHLVHKFDNISIHSAAFIPRRSCVLLAATVFSISGGLEPFKASPMQKLIVFNLETSRLEHDVPLGHNVQHLTVSQDGGTAIITFQNEPPPQLWHITRTATEIHLSLHRQLWSPYQKVKGHLKHWGKGLFLNKERFILCTTLDGEVHFWRRDETEAVHVVRAASKDKDKILEVACNPVDENFTFAARSRSGTVSVWKAPSQDVQAPG